MVYELDSFRVIENSKRTYVFIEYELRQFDNTFCDVVHREIKNLDLSRRFRATGPLAPIPIIDKREIHRGAEIRS
jgi:hypothetical protein